MAATITYAYPVSGTTPPTLAQTSNLVNAQVVWADADTTATITHNFNLSATSVAQLRPTVIFNLDPSSTGTASATITVTKGQTVVTLTKSTAAGSGGTLNVAILRPHSIER